jgi:class 3 adenylate cyclase
MQPFKPGPLYGAVPNPIEVEQKPAPRRAERAARAGLANLDAIAKLNEQGTRPKLSARVGIDSGAVVVGAGAGKEADVFGDAAARVHEAAAPGTVLITDAPAVNCTMNGSMLVIRSSPVLVSTTRQQ